MSTQEFNQGLVNGYIEEIAALGMQAQEGVDVKLSVSDVVERAATHFAIAKTGTELGNLGWFVGQLRVRAELVKGSRPQYSGTFESALELASALLKKKTA